MRELIAAITRTIFAAGAIETTHLPPRRVALLTGFPRSGTTLLEQVLDAHPDLVSSEERDFCRQGAVALVHVAARKNAASWMC